MILAYIQENERLEQISVEDREVIFTKRLIQIQKVCRKYGLSLENDEVSRAKNNLKKKYIQLKLNYTTQFSEKVDVEYF